MRFDDAFALNFKYCQIDMNKDTRIAELEKENRLLEEQLENGGSLVQLKGNKRGWNDIRIGTRCVCSG